MVKQVAAGQRFVPQSSPFSPVSRKRILEMLYNKETKMIVLKEYHHGYVAILTIMDMQLVNRIPVNGFKKINL